MSTVKMGVADSLRDSVLVPISIAAGVREVIGEEAEIPGGALLARYMNLGQINELIRRFRSLG
ncbi:MAG: hypothetical protein M0Z84_13160 [Gammaproteobacteria bacterium]|nr:hypothetical protein [Gammaproteobacteria bacterium]